MAWRATDPWEPPGSPLGARGGKLELRLGQGPAAPPAVTPAVGGAGLCSDHTVVIWGPCGGPRVAK